MKKINRRTFIAGLGATAAVAGLAGGYRFWNTSKEKPNIILFIADDMRWDAAGFMGNTIIKTPNLNRLAADGFVFENNFATTSICPISRANIMSGEYALNHHVYIFNNGMKRSSLINSFPVLLQEAGYHTGFIGKWGLEGQQPVKAFNYWRGYRGQGKYIHYSHGRPEHLTPQQTRQALKFLKERPKNKPFLLIVSYKSPHGPYIPQRRFTHNYDDITFKRCLTDTKHAFDLMPSLLKTSNGRKDYNTQLAKDEDYQAFMRHYYGLITGLDESIGIILKRVQHQKAASNTSVIFTSDNGLMTGEHGMLGKWCMYEDSIRTPLIIKPAARSMDFTPGRTQAIALNVDISPTILSMASVDIPGNVQGMNLLDVIRRPRPDWRDGFFYEHPAGSRRHHIIACNGWRGQEWKYTRYLERKTSQECLFNLRDDPLELNNLAGKPQYKEKLEEMRARTLKEKKALLEMDA
jgi:arylsulfatase A-like enzyme